MQVGAVILLLLWLGVAPTPLAAQSVQAPVSWTDPYTGSESESYLRTLQVGGRARLHPMGLRPFSGADLRSLAPAASGHPWSARIAPADSSTTTRFSWLAPTANVHYNSGFPQGTNDRALWTGRGVTLAAAGGLRAAAGPVTAVFAPEIFVSQNSGFTVPPGGTPFRNFFHPVSIDFPERFGDDAFARVAPGESFLRVEGRGVQLGLSTASQGWGPGQHLPLVLGTNAPGFAHVFAGTSEPLKGRLGWLHARVIWGALGQSSYSPETQDTRRFTSGWVLLASPAPLPGLELGITRFQHLSWPEGDWGGAILRPFESFLKEGVDPAASDNNQIASVIARWAWPDGGFEVYGEYAREDHSFHLRDFILLPDHTSAFMLGAAKVWTPSDRRWWQLRAELLNASRSRIVDIRYYGPYYLHHELQQGHTNEGQVLGSPSALGGGGARLELTRFDPDGRWTADVGRQMRFEPLASEWPGERYPFPVDVVYDAGLERLLFHDAGALSIKVSGAYSFDRYLASDALNLKVSLGGTFGSWLPRVSR